MAGMLDKYRPSTAGQSAVTNSGGVSGNSGVLSKYRPAGATMGAGVLDKYRPVQTRPRDTVLDNWRYEQQLRESLPKASSPAVSAAVPAQSASQNVMTAAERMEQAQKKRDAILKEYATAADPTAAVGEFRVSIAAAEKELKEAKNAQSREGAPLYDKNVVLQGTELPTEYDEAVLERGSKAAGNPLADFEGYAQDRRKATGQSIAAMFGTGHSKQEERRAEFLSQLQGVERQYVDYLYGTYDRQIANQLLQTYLTNKENEQRAAGGKAEQVEATLAQRANGEVPVYAQEYAKDVKRGEGLLDAAGSIVGGMLAKPAYAVETVAQGVKNLVNGTNLAAPLYSEAALAVADSVAAEERFLENIQNDKLRWVAGVGLSIANSAANRLLGPAGVFMMGLQAMGGDAYQMAVEGEDGVTQLVHSAVAGAAEGAAEKISWGKLDKILGGVSVPTFKGLLKQIGAQMVTEFGEEAVTEATNILTDWALRGEDSTMAQAIDEYVAQNGEDGKGLYALGVLAGQVALAGLGGAISGGVMGGGAVALNTAGQAQSGRQILEASKTQTGQNSVLQAMLEQAKQSTDKDVQMLAQSITARGAENARPAMVGALAQLLQENGTVTQRAADKPYGVAADIGEKAKKAGAEIVQLYTGNVDENTENVVADFSDEAAKRQEPKENTQIENADAVQYDVERTAINDNAAEHTPEQQKRIEQYKKAVNPKIVSLFQKAESIYSEWVTRDKTDKTTKKKGLEPVQVAKTNERARNAIQELAGIDEPGENVFLDQYAIEHIIKRHGKIGKQDRTMRYAEDVSRAGYVLDNFDDAYLLKKTSDRFMTKDNKRAPHVAFVKKLNGSFVVVEAVTDAKKGRCHIASAYITNDVKNIDAIKSWSLNENKEEAFESDLAGITPTPDLHVRNDHYTASKDSVAQPAAKVNAGEPQTEQKAQPDEMAAPEKKSDEKPDLQSTAKETAEAKKPDGWERLKENRIVQAMNHKPEGAVAKLGDAERVKQAETEIKKARKLLDGLKESAKPGEVDDAESVAKGNKTLQEISPNYSKEMVARMAEQIRLIEQWNERGLQGQRRKLHAEQFAAAEKLLEGADNAIFEHDPKAADELIGKRKSELHKLISTTSERVMHRVFDKASAQKAIEEYIRPAERNEAAKIMAIGRIFDGARKLKLNRYESTMVQLVGEKLVPEYSEEGQNSLWKNGQSLLEAMPEYARPNKELLKLAEHLDEVDAKKVMQAVQWYRKTYDDFYALVNDFRLAHGMPEIGTIENYFPHFSQDMDGDMLNRTLKAFGIEQMGNLPASISGMTAGFRPFSRWVGNFQKRTGPQTVFDAEQGLQMYANAVMDMLYHTDDIMRIRHLEMMIRQRSKEAAKTGKRPGTEERLERMKQAMEDPAQMERLEEELEHGERNTGGKDISGEYSGFVQWLREYGNKLANKGDTYRLTERVLGRSTANVINKMLGNYGSAQIVGNLRSAIANTTVLPKMLALLETKEGGVSVKPEIYIGQALGKMARGEMADIYSRSEFMASKQGVDPLAKTSKDKASNAMMWFFNVVENAMSKLAFTAGYVQAQDQLKDSKLDAKELERQAIQKANDFAAQVMSRRDKAGAALLNSSREPIIRLVSMFQTEISNEWQTIRQDMPREFAELESQVGERKAKAAYAAAAARYMVYSHVLGQVAELVLGINPFNDVFAWVAEFVRNIWEEPEEEDEKGKINLSAVTDLAGNVAGALPYINTVAALAGYTNDRLPLFNAKEFVEDVGSIFTANRASGKIEGIANVVGGAGQLLGIPGTGQAVKTAKGIIALADQGKRSQKTGQLQDVWQWNEGKGAGDFARALAFGPSAMKGMQTYYENGYKAELTKAQTDAYDAAIGAGVPKAGALEYVKWSKGVTVEKDNAGNSIPNSKRRQYIEKANAMEGLSAEQKAILYQGALNSEQAEEFETATAQVQKYGIDMETWMMFLEEYYAIYGKNKKQRVKAVFSMLDVPEALGAVMAQAAGYDIS